MLTASQKKKFEDAYKSYRKKYIVKKYSELDESATRIMINSFLTDVLGYIELEEIKTEYAIRGTYADYVIQLKKKQHIIIEVKSVQLNLTEKHIRQAINYASNEGIDWVLLTNGKNFQLYRVIFGKPVTYKEIFNYDIGDIKEFKASINDIEFLCKKCVSSGDLEKFWKRHQATEPQNLCKYLYKPEVIRFLKKDASLNFTEEDIFESVHCIIQTAIDSKKPKYK